MIREDYLLKTSEVAATFRVCLQTVNRWARSGKLGSIKTPGGERRFRESEVKALLARAQEGNDA